MVKVNSNDFYWNGIEDRYFYFNVARKGYRHDLEFILTDVKKNTNSNDIICYTDNGLLVSTSRELHNRFLISNFFSETGFAVSDLVFAADYFSNIHTLEKLQRFLGDSFIVYKLDKIAINNIKFSIYDKKTHHKIYFHFKIV